MHKYFILLSILLPLSAPACPAAEEKTDLNFQLEKLSAERSSGNWKCREFPVENFAPLICLSQEAEELELAALVERGPRFLCGKGPALIALHRCGGENEHPLCGRFRATLESKKEAFVTIMRKI